MLGLTKQQPRAHPARIAQPPRDIIDLATFPHGQRPSTGQNQESTHEMTNQQLGSAQSLTGLVEYQPESVVSRTLLNKPTGNVTLFAFDAGQRLSEHTTPHDALVVGLDGELAITVAGDQTRLSPGDVLLMPANKPHAVHADSRGKMLLVMIRAEAT